MFSLIIIPSIESSIKSTDDANYFSLQNETISDTLLDKFSDMTSTQNSINDRIITRITIIKDTPPKPIINLDLGMKHVKQQKLQQQQQKIYSNYGTKYATLNSKKLTSREQEYLNQKQESTVKYSNDESNQNSNGDTDNGMTLGISIVQGSDNNVYVKDLVKNGPGMRYGVLIGDQVA